MIIFIKGPLNVLNYFIDCMAAKEETSIILDMTQPDQMIKMINKWDSCINSSTIVITFNNIGIFLTTGQGNYWEQKQVMLYNYLVDHPINFMDEIKAAPKNTRFLLVDAGHCEFVKQNIEKMADRAYFLPHGGSDLGLYSNSERDIDVLYVGSCWTDSYAYASIDFLSGKEAAFYSFCYQMYQKKSYLQMDHIVDAYISQSGQSFTVSQRLILISLISMTVDHQFVDQLRRSFFVLRQRLAYRC